MKRLPHALLLSGPAEIGKRHFAKLFIQHLLCSKPLNNQACGKCKQCVLFSSGGHPDFLCIEPESPGKAISINDIRALAEFAVTTSHQQKWKVALVAPVEAMTLNAANAFLKTLEEPRDEVLLVLVHDQQAPVLPTIRSRCRIVNQRIPPQALVLNWLEQQLKKADTAAEKILARAGGRPLRALQFAQDNTLADIEQFERILRQVQSGEAPPISSAAAFEAFPFQQLLEWFISFFSQQLTTMAQRGIVAAPRYFVFYDLLLSTRKKLESKTNLNSQLLLEELFLNLRQLA